MLNFISSNGLHPRVSRDLVDKILTNYFGNNWHFTIVQSSFLLVAKTFDQYFGSVTSQPNSLL